MIEYPHASALIMTDSIYVAYGGHTGSSTQAQRAAAYLIAEKQMTQQIGTFLLPTIVTGTFNIPNFGDKLVLPYSYVHRIVGVTVLSQEAWNNCDLTESSGCAYIWNDTYGYIDPKCIESICNCSYAYPYQYRIAWESGLSTGTASQADMLLALTIVAEINLNEIIDPTANEGTGDIGIQEFNNQQYKETRVKLGRTAFGTSARAQKAAQLVSHLRRKRAIKL